MFRIATITFLLSYCTSFSQLIYSRDFETRKKNVPLTIINNNKNFFYLLRYNKAAHDITIERRAKPSAEIISFTPLKLDSVNADWFDYEKLDYLFFENNFHTYFLFEKVLNYKKTIYLKIIDTLGKASGFIELASLETEKGVTDINFEFKRTTSNNILIIATQTYGSFLIKKKAILFNIEKRKITWQKELPQENDITGYSNSFECNSEGDLFYVLAKSHTASFRRKYINHSQVFVPVLFYDSLTICSINVNASNISKQNLAINNVSGINIINLIPKKNSIIATIHFSKQNTDESISSNFLNQKFNTDLSIEYYAIITPLDNSINDCLTFYDGTDNSSPCEKEYKYYGKFEMANSCFLVSERVEEYYYKELVVWQIDFETGKILNQKIIPRKVYSFKGRTRFKNIGVTMPFIYNEKLNLAVLESPENVNLDPNNFSYHKFKKETNLWKSNIIMYQLSINGNLAKRVIYENANYDVVPLPYQSINQEEMIFYLNGGTSEKFAILQLNQF
ncbi:MAG: hypothetical protein Q7W45_11440 [Bacteroidota bacterium]|nr:hypothetical protein [Bacteroidota bacterium]MDP3147061.1 hypothetical protein [Bacteroidota bacterium]